MYYNNPASSNQEDPEDVWDSGYQGVWHLNETVADEATTGKHYDSTTNSADGSQQGNDDGTGKIAGAQFFDGEGVPEGDTVFDLINVDNMPSNSWTDLTIEAWVWIPLGR